MFKYNLTGKSVILVLDEEILPYVKNTGIAGSPIFVPAKAPAKIEKDPSLKRIGFCPKKRAA